MDLYITRHGESDTNKYGGLDPYLTEKGNAQAQLLGSRLGVIRLDAVYVSPLIRAVQTASAVIAMQENVYSEVLPQLYETGTDAGYTYKKREEMLEYCPSLTVPEPIPCTQDSDDPEQCLSRAASVIDFVKKRHNENDKVLLVAHGSFNTYLILASLRFPVKYGFNFSQDNTGLTLIRFLKEKDGTARTKLVFMNDVSHLLKNRLI